MNKIQFSQRIKKCFENECMTSVDFRHFIVRLGKKNPKLFYVRKKVGNRSCPFNALLSGEKPNVFKVNLEPNFNLKLNTAH